jgi:hypothetical protein
MPLGDLQDARRQGGREERRLARRRRLLQDRFEILGESHVEHFVRLVEHEDANRLQRQRLAADMVQGAAGSGHHDVGAAIERSDLLLHRGPAVERHDGEAGAAGVLVDRLADLHRQLTGRNEHQARGVPGRGLAAGGHGSGDVRRWIMGNANAAVLPVPVAACASRSRPVSINGMVSRCTGVGSS